MHVLFLLKSTVLHEHIGIITLSSILKGQGHTVDLLLTEKVALRQCLKKVRDLAPDILAYSVITGDHNYYIHLNQKIRRQYDAFSVFGGPHCTFQPDIIKNQYVDAVCRGEGDICFPQLVTHLGNRSDFYATPNFWFKKPDGSIVKNEIGPLVENLDELPLPDRKLMYDADPALRAKGLKMFITMRGCPFQCSYCFNHVYNKLIKGKGRALRYRSVDNVLAEMTYVKENYFLDCVYVYDDTFLVKPDGWLEEFAEKYLRVIGLPIVFTVRANIISDYIVQLIKKMGCSYVGMGVECGDEDIANKILKRKVSNRQIVNACDLLHKYNIKILTTNITGLPVNDPLKAGFDTLDFNIRLKADFALSLLLYPYPGTEIEKIAAEKGMLDVGYEKNVGPNQTESALIFESLTYKRKVVNLNLLFGIIVQFPFLRPLAPFFISLPITRLYSRLYFALFGCKILQLSSGKRFFRTIYGYIPFYFNHLKSLKQ